MRRFVRRTLIGVSLFLCLAMLSLWARSYFKGDSLDRFRQNVAGPGTYHDTAGVFSNYGSIGVGYLRMKLPTAQDWPDAPRWQFHPVEAQVLGWPRRWWVLGFGYWNVTFPPGPAHTGMHVVGVQIPHWFIALLFGVAPAVWGRRKWIERRTRKRLRIGLCTACGYDVRASAERCPECGTSRGAVAAPRRREATP